MIRILFVTESLFPLGPAQQLALVANGLIDRDVQVEICLLASEDQTGLGLQPQIDSIRDDHRLEAYGTFLDPRIRVHYLQRGVAIRGVARAGMQSVFRLRQLVRSLQPNIVHHWCGNTDWIAQAALQLQKNSPSRPRLLRTELGLQPTKRFSHWLFENKLAHPYEVTVVGHDLVRQQMLDQHEMTQQRERIVVIPNRLSGAPESSVAERKATNESAGFGGDELRTQQRSALRSRLNLPPEAKLAGTVAPLMPRTRLKDLIWATDLLTCVRDDFHFLIWGWGDQEARLRRFASLTEAESHVHFLGEPDESLSVLAGLDVYWHSHLQQPLCTNLMNAMSLGIPAISVYGAGTEELIRHQQSGFAVNFGARDEFARWTKYVLEMSGQAEQLARQGQAFVQARFSGSLADDYWQLYNR